MYLMSIINTIPLIVNLKNMNNIIIKEQTTPTWHKQVKGNGAPTGSGWEGPNSKLVLENSS